MGEGSHLLRKEPERNGSCADVVLRVRGSARGSLAVLSMVDAKRLSISQLELIRACLSKF